MIAHQNERLVVGLLRLAVNRARIRPRSPSMCTGKRGRLEHTPECAMTQVPGSSQSRQVDGPSWSPSCDRVLVAPALTLSHRIEANLGERSPMVGQCAARCL